jgi:colanic acid/amylovoran biosynthesis glycosyltransferase
MSDELPMRVGYVLRRFPVLSETFILNEILALEKQGIEVSIFALAPTRDPKFHEGLSRLRGNVSYIPSLLEWKDVLKANRRLYGKNPQRYRSALWKALRSFNPTFIWRFLQAGCVADKARSARLQHLHAHFANRATTVASLASRLTKIPYSFTAHAFDIFIEGSQRHLNDRMTRARFVVTVSDCNIKFLTSILAGRAARLVKIYNGIDLSRFTPGPPPPPMPPLHILAVARLVEKKGLPILVEACALLRDRGVDFRCTLVGKGAMRPILEGRIKDLGLGEFITMPGARTQGEVLELYRASHVFALPCIVGDDGNRDGLPVSIVEALACGLPVVSTPVTGIPEAVLEGVNGFLVPEKDVRALADALERLARDHGLRERLAGGARDSVASKFDQDQTAKMLHDLLAEAP